MQAVSYLPSIVDLFAAIGGFATLYGGAKIARTFVARWRAAAASKTARDERIEALEQAFRELADLLDKRTAPAPDPAKGGIG
ncbi:hypothetical protein GJ689_25055 [Rhodoplanes serenus]|jgi:hypothetical protein|uniref:Uncharacterized protein n=1 Tax=Rhodoplanes serenus TaxID=200615 RepID=A0A3S4BXT0_9BRAD|nr:hypothetical protein [Rhodoplanes serenus]MTW19463.1 hypothetical protein [Rhodoplanes serenus]VCU10149.1 hypothetical protein RHODGE_RHODGE_03335 [Rhodoplanes serenus]